MENKVITRIEIILGDPENPLIHFTGQVDEEIVDQTLKFFGLRYRPLEPPIPCKPLRVNCPLKSECLDYPDKCGSCAQNKMEHLFKETEAHE